MNASFFSDGPALKLLATLLAVAFCAVVVRIAAPAAMPRKDEGDEERDARSW